MSQLVVANITITPGEVRIVTVGTTGRSGYSGHSGQSGKSGYSGMSGYSGANPGASGYSGYSGKSGYSGRSGFSGFSGAGTSGFSGYSGTVGTSGFSGFSGTSGFSGYSGNSGFSGYSGISGKSGYSGISGYSGYSGAGSVWSMAAPAGTTVANAATSFLGLQPTVQSASATTSINTSSTEAFRQIVTPKDITVSRLYVITSNAQPANGSLVVTLRDNGADTALTLTISGGAAAGTFSDVTHTAAVSAGHLISVGVTNNSADTVSALITQWAVVVQ